MTFFSITKDVANNTELGGRHRHPSFKISLRMKLKYNTTGTLGDRKTVKKPYLGCKIGGDLGKKAGFKKGDIVDLLLDPTDGLGCILRSNTGRSLSANKKSEFRTYHVEYKKSPLTPPIEIGEEIFMVSEEVKNGKIFFELPKTLSDRWADILDKVPEETKKEARVENPLD